jgi:O-antigen ligase
VGAFGLATLIAWWGPGLKKAVALAWAYVLGNCASVAYALIQGETSWEGRRAGWSEHPNIYGLCGLLGVSLIPFLVSQTARSHRWIPVAVGLVNFWALWTSGSRGALAALIVVAVVYPLLSRSVLAGLGLLGVLTTVLVFSEQLLGGAASSNALGRLLGQGSATGSDTEREQLAEAALDQFWSHPILGASLVDVIEAHIIYLQIIAAMGIIGLLFFIVAGWATIRPAFTLEPPLSLLALPALSYATVGWVTPLLWDRYIWVTLGLSLIAPYLVAKGPPTDEPPTDERVFATHRAQPRSKTEFP